MTIDIGKKVKLATDKNSPVGVIYAIDGEEARVEYQGSFSEPIDVGKHPLSDLIQVCSERVLHDFGSSECGRPVKEGDLCGVHAGAQKRRETQRKKWKAAQEAANAYLAETQQLEAALNTQIDSRGLRVGAPSLKVLRAREGTVSIRLDELLTLIRNT